MSDFSDRPFVAGSLVGLRAFAVDKYGRLTGPSFGHVFRPGENDAECHSEAVKFSGLPSGSTVSVQYMDSPYAGRTMFTAARPAFYLVKCPDGTEHTFGSVAEAMAMYPPKAVEHIIGAATCTCGYYAYFDGASDYSAPNRVTAVVEGYGICTVGERGFRASKARVLAFVKPEPEPDPVDVEEMVEEPKRRSLWSRVFPHWWNGFFVALNLACAARAAVYGEWWWQFALSATCAVVLTATWLFGAYVNRQNKETEALTSGYVSALREHRATQPSDVDWQKVQRAYPDVPTFPSIAAALAVHSLTPPPPITPDDEDFWTREVPR